MKSFPSCFKAFSKRLPKPIIVEHSELHQCCTTLSPVLEMNFLGIKSELKDIVAECKERCQGEGTDKDSDESVLELE